jgi:hypothetical protein
MASSSGRNHFNGVKVFSATMAQDRDQLGERVTRWLSENVDVDVVDILVNQSSDKAFHCLTITLFFSTDSSRLPAQ